MFYRFYCIIIYLKTTEINLENVYKSHQVIQEYTDIKTGNVKNISYTHNSIHVKYKCRCTETY